MKKTVAYNKSENLRGWLFLLPLIIMLCLFYLYPIFENIHISLTNYSSGHLLDYEYKGFVNYASILSEHLSGLTGMVIWTITFALSVVILSLILGSIIAVMLENMNFKLSRIYRSIFILPWVIPAVITILMWRGLLDGDQGFVNSVLISLGIGRIPWFDDSLLARFTCIFVMIWFSFPYMTVVAQGILKAIPRNYYEAAYMDGAKAYHSFRYITMPILVKAMLPTLIMSFIMQFNNFGVYMLTQGRPAAGNLGDPGATDLLITYIFKEAFRSFRYDTAAAYSVILFIFIAIVSVALMKLGKKIGADS
jgi:ABC-type sugar transport systems, permease components